MQPTVDSVCAISCMVELACKLGAPPPTYDTIEEPPLFRVNAKLGTVTSSATSTTKKAAKNKAANVLFEKMSIIFFNLRQKILIPQETDEQPLAVAALSLNLFDQLDCSGSKKSLLRSAEMLAKVPTSTQSLPIKTTTENTLFYNWIAQLNIKCQESQLRPPNFEDVVEGDDSNGLSFKVKCILYDTCVVGYGTSQKEAKQDAAKLMFKRLEVNVSHYKKLHLAMTAKATATTAAAVTTTCFPSRSKCASLSDNGEVGTLQEEQDKQPPAAVALSPSFVKLDCSRGKKSSQSPEMLAKEPSSTASTQGLPIKMTTGNSPSCNWIAQLNVQCQKSQLRPPSFEDVVESGDSNELSFKVKCILYGMCVVGYGTSQKEAKQDAAKLMCQRLEVNVSHYKKLHLAMTAKSTATTAAAVTTTSSPSRSKCASLSVNGDVVKLQEEPDKQPSAADALPLSFDQLNCSKGIKSSEELSSSPSTQSLPIKKMTENSPSCNWIAQLNVKCQESQLWPASFESGDSNRLSVKVKCILYDMCVVGYGMSRKEAKQDAARLMCKRLDVNMPHYKKLHLEVNTKATATLAETVTTTAAFSSRSSKSASLSVNGEVVTVQEEPDKQPPVAVALSPSFVQLDCSSGKKSLQSAKTLAKELSLSASMQNLSIKTTENALSCNWIAQLNIMCQKSQLRPPSFEDVVEGSNNNGLSVKVKCILYDMCVVGYGTSQKEAKQDAARIMCKRLEVNVSHYKKLHLEVDTKATATIADAAATAVSSLPSSNSVSPSVNSEVVTLEELMEEFQNCSDELKASLEKHHPQKVALIKQRLNEKTLTQIIEKKPELSINPKKDSHK